MEPDPQMIKKAPEPGTLPPDADNQEAAQDKARPPLPGLRELVDETEDGMTVILKQDGVEIGRAIIRKKR